MNRQVKSTSHSNISNNLGVSAMRATLNLLASSSGDIATDSSLLSTHQSPSNAGSHSDQSPTKIKKTVSFSPTSRCLVIPSRHDMTAAQKAATWSSPEETMTDQEDTVRTIRAARHLGLQGGLHVPTSTNEAICLRGLENLMNGCKQLKLIKKQRDDLVRNVLLVQERHRQMGYQNADPNLLQAISETFSQDHVARAIMLGASDAAYVRRQLGRDHMWR